MCISLAISLLSAGIGAMGSMVSASASSAAAQSQAKWNAYNLDVQNKQLEDERDMTRLKAQQTEADRLTQDRQMRGRNMAFLAMSGTAENNSFFEGADKANEEAMRRDVGTLRLNSQYQISRIADQISVNNANKQFGFQKADMESSAAFTKAGFSAASGFLTAGQDYYKYRT